MLMGKGQSIIRGMLHIYRMYKFVKLVDKENAKLSGQAILAVQNGGAMKNFNLVRELDVINMFTEKRIFFVRLDLARASQISMAALKKRYLEPTEKSKDDASKRFLRVTHEKGLPLLDGFFLFRPGLWKAWHVEHGWLFTSLVAGGVMTGLIYLAKHSWFLIK